MQISRGDFLKPSKNDDCNTLAPIVMALFDGEANESETRRARSHLLVCQTCANRWLDWNRARDLLRVAPASTPPLLVWRVLTACRLAESSRPAPAKIFGFLRPRARRDAPATLKAQILSSTTQKARQPKLPARRPAVSLFKVPYLAVPALAVWLMVLQQDTLLVPASVSPLKVAATPGAMRRAQSPKIMASASQRSVPLPRTSLNTKAALSPTLSEVRAVSFPRLLEGSVPAQLAVLHRSESRRIGSVSNAEIRPSFNAESSHAREIVREVAIYSRFVSLSASQTERFDTLESQNTPPRRFRQQSPSRAMATQPAPQILAARGSQTAPRRAQFALLAPNRAPRLRAARWKNGAAPTEENFREAAVSSRYDSPIPSQLLRVSLPTSTPPTSSRARLLSDNFEGEDERVEEMRSVVDDFRATLASDDSAGEE